jgi:hypothetical protein
MPRIKETAKKLEVRMRKERNLKLKPMYILLWVKQKQVDF